MVEVVQDQVVASSSDMLQAVDGETTRKSGIPVIGNVPWGTHFCLFYRKKDDLIDALAPFFRAGLESNEFCMLVTSEPLGSARDDGIPQEQKIHSTLRKS
jgi:hypothetical protein